MVVSDIEGLHRLVDLSLHSPEFGIVNFQNLHKVLHGILSHIGLTYDGKILTQIHGVTPKQNDNNVETTSISNGFRMDSDETSGSEKAKSIEEESGKPVEVEKKDVEVERRPRGELSSREVNRNDQDVESLKSKQRHLENKISNLEDKLKLLDDLPSNQTIIQEAQQTDTSTGVNKTKDNTLSGIWQFMKMNSRLQAAEDAIDRVMSILNEFLGSGTTLGQITGNLQDLSNELQSLKDKLNESSTTQKDDSSGRVSDLENILVTLATRDDLKEYVKWPALEEALQVRKEQNKKVVKTDGKADTLSFDQDREKTNESLEGRPKTSPAPPTQSPVTLSDVPKTAMTSEFTQVTSKDLSEGDKDSPHPSPEVVECLRRISELSTEHDKINEVLSSKMDKHDLNIPSDLQDQLNSLQKGFDSLMQNAPSDAVKETTNVAMDNKDKIDAIKRELAAMSRQAKQSYIERPAVGPVIDNEAMDAIRKKLVQLQDNQEAKTGDIEKKLSDLLENLEQKKELIENLYKYIKDLKDNKAEKQTVAMEMDYKADKTALENLVNTATFDSTFSMLDEGLREAAQKMDDYMNEELALKQTLQQLSCDMKEKMDSEAFKAMQSYLEKRIADVQKSRTMIARETNVDLSGAAGLRRPLPINFHCISCNRPIEVKYTKDAQPSLPKAESVHIKRSKGPYLSYEMDQLRNFNRGQQSMYRPEKLLSDILTSRPCGGSHTVMHQQIRKPARIHNTQLGHVLNGSGSEDVSASYPSWTRDLSVIDMVKGSDGHVYKGRYKAVPPITRRHKHTPSESDLPPVRKDQSPPLTGHKWSSEPELSRARDESVSPVERHHILHMNQTKYEHKCTTPPTSQKVSSNTRSQRIPNQKSSDPNLVPFPSPPTARENEYQHRIDREDFLRKQQEELEQEILFSPRKQTTDSRKNQDSQDRIDGEEYAARLYSPNATKMTRPSKLGGNDVVGTSAIDFTKERMSVDSVDDIV